MFLLEKSQLKRVLEAQVVAVVAVVVGALAPQEFGARQDAARPACHSRLTEAYWPLWKASASWKLVLSTLVEAVADRRAPLLRPVAGRHRPSCRAAARPRRLGTRMTPVAGGRRRDHGDARREVHAAVVHVARDALAVDDAEAERRQRQA